MSSFISCYNQDRELEHFEVPEPVLNYILHLESELNYGLVGAKRRYAFIFGEKND